MQDLTPTFPVPTAEHEVTLPFTAADVTTGTSLAPDATALPNRTTVANRVLTANPGDSLQPLIDNLSAAGGGTLNLAPGTFTLPADLSIPSFINLIGVGLTTIIDGNGAYGIKIIGSNAYTTGTVALSYGDTTVVGSGTTFTAAMVGRSILLEDFWYLITAFTDTTHLTIDRKYMGATLSGSSYVIATTVNTVNLSNFLYQNTSGSGIKFQYVNGINFDGVLSAGAAIGIEGADSSFFNILNGGADQCTKGMTFNNVQFGTYFNNNTTQCTGNGTEWTKCRNWCIDVFAFVDIGGVAMQFTNCNNDDILDFSLQQVGSHGIEFVSGCSDIGIPAGVIKGCGGDGIKLTATSDNIQLGVGLGIHNNAGYGVNIAASTCDTNTIIGNNLHDNTTGAVNDSGTGTKIRSNIGVADN